MLNKKGFRNCNLRVTPVFFEDFLCLLLVFVGLFDKTHFPETNVSSAGCFREQRLKNHMLTGLSWGAQSSFSGAGSFCASATFLKKMVPVAETDAANYKSSSWPCMYFLWYSSIWCFWQNYLWKNANYSFKI